MNKFLSLTFALLGIAYCATAPAATIYKCRQAGGVTSYQDTPCPGRQIGVLRSAASPAKSTAKPVPVAPGSVNSAPTAKARPVPTGRATRPSFICTRPNGSFYYSGDARSNRRLVDASAAAPLTPIVGAPAAPPGKAWAQDQCEPATRSETCQYYQEKISYTDAQQQRAKGGDAQKLTREGKRLRAIHNHRCQ